VKSNTFPGHWISLKVISPFTQASSNLADAGFELDVFGRDLFEVDLGAQKQTGLRHQPILEPIANSPIAGLQFLRKP
jgi:hypothetical protein